MAPIELLILAVAVTFAAGGWYYLIRYQQRQTLTKLAREMGMNFVGFDRFHLAQRVRELFPVPGAADVRVIDVIYGLSDDCYRYLFTVQYTEGVLRTKHRRQRVAAVMEPRSAGVARPAELLVAAPGDDHFAQYRTLATTLGCRQERSATDGTEDMQKK
jgi:hypothetical protein